MKVAEKIVSQPRDGNDNPKDRIEMTVDLVTKSNGAKNKRL
jgi:hypothetical protein